MTISTKRPGSGPVDNSKSLYAHWKTLGFHDVEFRDDDFWAPKLNVNRKISLRYGHDMLEKAGNFDNLRIAAGLMEGTFRGYVFQDSDIYKWLEAVAWELGHECDAELSALADQAIELINATQQADGYINSYVQTRLSPEPWKDMVNGHELYCAGHLFQAAVAFQRALGDKRLSDIACRFADHIASVFGLGKRQATCGHPEIEMALVELARMTGKPQYLDLAKFFIDQRGKNSMRGHNSYGPEYHQDHLPVRQVREAAGHSVRQLYLAAGVSDLFMETGEGALLEAMEALSQDIVATKSYITGGFGSRFDGEAFGDPYELPADQGYCETCAAIASFLWNWRMLLATGKSRYADQMERSLYNNILASPALDGTHYFYMNPLLVRDARHLRLSNNQPIEQAAAPGQRPTWHDCACCPPNVMRLFSSLAHYLATYNADGVQIHHFANADIHCDRDQSQPIQLRMATGFPWQGGVRLDIIETESSPWTLSLRIPEWSPNPGLSINGQKIGSLNPQNGYLALKRTWKAGDVIELQLNVTPTFIASNPRIDSTRGCLVIQRGPIVYCLEDQDQEVQGHLLDIEIDRDKPLKSAWKKDFLGGVVTVEAQGQVVDFEGWRGRLYQPALLPVEAVRRPARLIAVPYYAWGNRTIGGMRVWIPEMPLSKSRGLNDD